MADSLLFVITTLDRGGAESQVLELARAQHRRGRTVTVASLLPGGALAQALVGMGVPVHDLGMQRGAPDPWAIVRLARIIRQVGPAIVHAHMVHANLLSRLARPLAPHRLLVNTAHSVDEEGRGREQAYRASAGLCDVMTNVSAHGAARYRRLGLAPAHSMLHIPNGLDPMRFRTAAAARAAVRDDLGVGAASWLWLAVGRLEPPKDPVTLIRAFARHARPDELLFFAGAGSLRDEALAAVAASGMASRIRLLGDRPDVPSLLAAADGVVLSSHWEGHPMIVLEAAAAGRPMVATAAPGTVDVIEDGVTGLLAAPGDPGGLGAALSRLRDLPSGAREAIVSAAARRLDEAYGIDAIVDRWDALYSSRMAARPRRRAARG